MRNIGQYIAGPEGSQRQLAEEGAQIEGKKRDALLLLQMVLAQIALKKQFAEQTLAALRTAAADEAFAFGKVQTEQENGQSGEFGEKDTGTQTADFGQTALHLGCGTVAVEPHGPVAQMTQSQTGFNEMMGGVGEKHHGVGLGVEAIAAENRAFALDEGARDADRERQVEKIVMQLEGEVLIFGQGMMIAGMAYLCPPFAQQSHGALHSVGIGKPQVYIAVHAQSRNGIEGIQRVALEHGTADAGLGKPAQHLVAGGTEELLLMAHGMVIAEPLHA